MTKRIVTRLGDIFEVLLDNNLKAYFQYIMRDMTELNGDVIRVFQTRYSQEEDVVLEKILDDSVDFYVHTSVLPGAKQGLWHKVGNVKVPIDIERPCFRGTDDDYASKKISKDWYIWRANDNETTYIGKFTEKYKHCDKGGIYPPFAIKDRIQSGDDGFLEPAFS